RRPRNCNLITAQIPPCPRAAVRQQLDTEEGKSRVMRIRVGTTGRTLREEWKRRGRLCPSSELQLRQPRSLFNSVASDSTNAMNLLRTAPLGICRNAVIR